MFTNKIYNFLKFTEICSEYVTLNVINNLLLINCCEQDLIDDLILEDLFPELNENTFDINDCYTEKFILDNPEVLNISESYFEDLQQNHQSDFSDENINQDEHESLILTYPSPSQYLSQIEIVDFFEKLPDDFTTSRTNYLSDDCAMEVVDKEYDSVSKNIETPDDPNSMANSCQKNIISSEYLQTTPNETITEQQIEPVVASQCDIKEIDHNNYYLDICGNPVDIYTASCSTNYLSNISNYEAYINPNLIEKNMEIISTEKDDYNTYVKQKINNHPSEGSYINNIQKLDELLEKNDRIFNDSNHFTYVNLKTKMNSRLKNKPKRNYITDNQNKQTKFSKHYITELLKRKIEKNIQQTKTFKPVVKETFQIFLNDIKELVADKEYNLNICIFPFGKKKKTYKFLKNKKFIFEIVENTTSKTKTEEPCQKITYSISSIPKFFIPKFQTCKGILSIKKKQIPKLHDFYYKLERTIELRNSEELKIKHLVPDLIPDKKRFWEKKYYEVITRWEYGFLESNKGVKTMMLRTNSKVKHPTIKHFLNNLPNIAKDKGIKNTVLNKMLAKITDFNNHIKHMKTHYFTSKDFKTACMEISKFGKEFYATRKLSISIKEANALEIEIFLVYNRIYKNFNSLLISILYCYNEFLKKDNEDPLTY